MSALQTAGLWLLAVDLAFIAAALCWIAVQAFLERRADVRLANMRRDLGNLTWIEPKRREKARQRHPAVRGPA